MRLNVQERFALLAVLPQQGDFLTLKVVRELRESLSFSDEEHEALKFQMHDDNHVTLEQDGEPIKDFPFGWKQEDVIREALKKADKEKKLTLENLAVYEKFMESSE